MRKSSKQQLVKGIYMTQVFKEKDLYGKRSKGKL